MPDEVIAELWRTKDDMAREYGYDIGRLAAALQAQQGAAGHRVVDLQATRAPADRSAPTKRSPSARNRQSLP